MSNTKLIQTSAPSLNRDGVRRIIQVFAGLFLFALVLFLSAGRLDWPMAWVYIGLYLISVVGMGFITLRKNPEVINRRGRKHEDTKGWDKVWGAVYSPMPFIVLAVAGLDAGRYGWSTMPVWLEVTGIIMFTFALMMTYWSMNTNPHFETTVRIQKDRDHQTITSGPYQYMRHPGYVGGVLLYSGTPLVLGSWWAFIPSVLIGALIIWRTAREDRTLQEELSDYAEYAQRVRYRLLPGVW